jgi:hypothetical protein
VLPLATASAENTALPPAANLPLTAVNTVAVVTVVPQVNAPDTTPHLPLEEVRVNPLPDVAAVNEAQVPVVYHVPAEMRQPVFVVPTFTLRYPFPLKGVPGVVVPPGVEAVVVVEPPPVLGRYLMPVVGQVDFVPSGFAATKVPVCTEPRTS